MASKKKVPYVWKCEESGVESGGGDTYPARIKEMKRKKFSKTLRRSTVHKAKQVKKGGTKKNA